MRFAGLVALRVDDWGFQWEDLAVEAALRPGLLGQGLGAHSEHLDVFARQAAPLGDALGCLELFGHVDVPGRRVTRSRLGTYVGAEGDLAHRLDAARDADVAWAFEGAGLLRM